MPKIWFKLIFSVFAWFRFFQKIQNCIFLWLTWLKPNYDQIATIKLKASVINKFINYFSSIKDNIWPLLDLFLLHSDPFDALQVFSKKEGARKGNTSIQVNLQIAVIAGCCSFSKKAFSLCTFSKNFVTICLLKLL